MLKTKIVVRIIGSQGELLGWGEALAGARGDGKLWIDEPMAIFIEQPGVPAFLSRHWCDLNVEVRSAMDVLMPVTAGQVWKTPANWEVITVGPAAGGLPPVTVRGPVSIAVPVGALAARTH